MLDLAFEVDHQPHRLAEAAPARQLVGGERVEAAVGGGEQQLVGGLRVEGEGAARRLP